MQERYLGLIQPGMDVCDVNGGKVGSVARVYRYDIADAGTMAASAPASGAPLEEVVEVKTGPLGLGGRLYVPLKLVQDVASKSVFLSVARDDNDMVGLKNKPDHLDRLH
jgi:hypothetical protein